MSLRWMVIFVALAAQLALTVFGLLRQNAPAPAPVTTFAPVTIPVPYVIEPAAAPNAPRPSCPPPRTDAPRLPKDHELPREVNHVTTSQTNAGWIAAWSEQDVHVSADAGRTFRQVLDGPGDVRDVTFDCFGRVIVLRDSQLGIHDGSRESWRAVPGMRDDDEARGFLIGGGPDVVVIASTRGETNDGRVAVSPDLGKSWWFRDLPVYWPESDVNGMQSGDGVIHLALRTVDCMHEPVLWVRIANGVVETEELGSIGVTRLYGDYAIAMSDEPKWKRFGDKTWRTIEGLPQNAELWEGPVPRASVDGVVYRIDRGRAKRLEDWAHGPGAVDRAGRLWAIDETIDGESAWAVFDYGASSN